LIKTGFLTFLIGALYGAQISVFIGGKASKISLAKNDLISTLHNKVDVFSLKFITLKLNV